MKYKLIKKLIFGDITIGETGDVLWFDEEKGVLSNFKKGTSAYFKDISELQELIDSYIVPYTEPDPVNHPSHYAESENGIECIDAMIAAYGKESVMAFCKCNAFKYLFRFEKKNGIEDLKKAQWYLNKYIELNETV